MPIAKEHYDQCRKVNTGLNYFESRNNHAIVNSKPLRLCFDISRVCNISCVMCNSIDFRGTRKDVDAFLPLETLERYEPLLPYIELGQFCAFESIIHPRFRDFVDYLRRFFTPFEITTNGLAMDRDLSAFCLDRGLVSLICSLNAGTRATHESINRGSSFGTVIKNLQDYAELVRDGGYDAKLTLSFAVMRQNIEELPALLAIAAKLNVGTVRTSFTMAVEERQNIEHETMFFHQRLYNEKIAEAKRIAAHFGIELLHSPLFEPGAQVLSVNSPCYAPWEQIYVAAAGETTVCCSGACPIGNMYGGDFLSFWNNDKVAGLRADINSDRRPPQCRNCLRGHVDPFAIESHIPYLRRYSGERLEEKREQVRRKVRERLREAAPA